MSWEIVKEDSKPCPCGKGFVSRILKADDWNRSEITVSLNCLECNKNYVKYTYDYPSSGMLETATRKRSMKYSASWRKNLKKLRAKQIMR